MKRISVALKKRIAALELLQNPVPLRPENSMAVPAVEMSLAEWGYYAQMQQKNLKLRAMYDGEQPDIDHPYPDEWIAHEKNLKWVLHA